MNRNAIAKISYGLYIISSGAGDQYNGCIANTVFQITSEDPKLAVSINKQNLTHQMIEKAGFLPFQFYR